MPALNVTPAIPHRFRSYRARKYQTVDCKIWEAARATSATPTFFEPIIIGDPGTSQPYVDGGMGCNNPIAQVLEEAELVFPTRRVACVISLGAGRAQTLAIPRPGWLGQVLPLDLVQAMRGIATDCEQKAQEVARRFQGLPDFYFRFNVEQGMQDIGLAQWERLGQVTTHTVQYMKMVEVDQNLDAVVAAVRARRATVPTAHISMEPDSCFLHELTSSLTCRWCDPTFCHSSTSSQELPSSHPCLHWKRQHSV
jgi:predicted acylesterase/phospholipase RssA